MLAYKRTYMYDLPMLEFCSVIKISCPTYIERKGAHEKYRVPDAR